MTRYALIALAALALVLAGCGGNGEEEGATTTSTTSTTSAKTIKISEVDFELKPSTVNVDSAGTYEIQVTNDGQTDHALEVEGNGLEEQRTDTLAPGDSATLTVDLKAGKYEMYCPVDGHKAQGMEGDISVG